MMLPDVNVLLYAFRSDAAHHSRYRTWLKEMVAGPAAYGMSPQVLSGVIRVGTHPKVFAKPSRLSDTLAFANTLLEQPNCQIVSPGPRHWSIFTGLCRQAPATGSLTADAWLAALAIESGCEWITTGRDFARFPGLRWRAPFAQ